MVTELFASEARSLVRLARIFCDDSNAAEDLVQEAFIRLDRSVSTIRDRDKAPAFLRSIVINLARDHNRRGLMSLRHRSAMTPQPRSAEFDDDPAAELENRELLAALQLLSERQRTCLVLRFYLGLSEREIGETIGISKDSVKTHCRRGLHALEAAMRETP
ncbi:MAG: sigma-70 family RNA polymerase sigma factor [Acidimicrobiales bacterium]|nr:sigma-70 family RNA polymerase sigma factor [Acidimicrobiales bacterium]